MLRIVGVLESRFLLIASELVKLFVKGESVSNAWSLSSFIRCQALLLCCGHFKILHNFYIFQMVLWYSIYTHTQIILPYAASYFRASEQTLGREPSL